MDNNLVKVCYNGETGSNDIRTFHRSEILYISLRDVLITLNKENKEIDDNHVVKSMVNVIKGQMKALDSDEYVMVPVIDGSYVDDEEVFVTQPGLYRVLSGDRSHAGKIFQRWLFHEVVPSLTKYGEYPPPLVSQDSDVKRLAKTLLLEIEQREELERKTQEQFNKHEKMLNHLGSKLQNLNSNNLHLEFMSVTDFCNLNEIDKTNEQLIFGWSIKICAEKGEPSRKSIIQGKEILQFPQYVLIASAKELKIA
ncbi:BRO family protein [Colwellia sp. RE-S-Sl-9]